MVGFCYAAISQNVGIGTNVPAYPLTVVANNEGKGIAQTMGNTAFGIVMEPAASSNGVVLRTLSNHVLGIGANSSGAVISILPDGRVNIGISGNISPYKVGIHGEVGFSQGVVHINGGIQIGSIGNTIQNIVHGVHNAGASATAQLTTTITFPNAFSSPPKLFATVRHDPAWNISDAFSITVKSISNTQAVLIIRRLDAAQPWSQQLLVDWMAVR